MTKLAFLFLLLLSGFFLYQSVLSYSKIRLRSNELGFLREQVAELEEKLKDKQEELAYRKSADFIYKVALEQLGLTRPGEVIAVLPDWVEKEKTSAEGSRSEGTAPPAAAASEEPSPYWKQWRQLFFEN